MSWGWTGIGENFFKKNPTEGKISEYLWSGTMKSSRSVSDLKKVQITLHTNKEHFKSHIDPKEDIVTTQNTL